MVKLFLARKYFTETSTIGVLQVDGGVTMFTLEDTDRFLEKGGVKIPKKTAIPRGVYPVTIDFSNRFKKDMLHILNVPQFEGIRIHAGNEADDTEGCILVGGGKGKDVVLNSKVTLSQLFLLVKDAIGKEEKVSIEIT